MFKKSSIRHSSLRKRDNTTPDEDESISQESENLKVYKKSKIIKKEQELSFDDDAEAELPSLNIPKALDSHSILIEKKSTKIEDDKPKNDELYYGSKSYKKYIQKREPTNSKFNPIGPVQTPLNIRSTSRFDYQPDVCKDYKETGYCGFGDSCKFLHDRGDYKHGWQIDRDWEESQKMASQAQNFEEDPNFELVDDDLPFACFICREEFTNPVSTKYVYNVCGHYFCEACALKNYKKSSKCYVCQQNTGGQFSVASDLIKKLQEKKLRLEEQRKLDEQDFFADI